MDLTIINSPPPPIIDCRKHTCAVYDDNDSNEDFYVTTNQLEECQQLDSDAESISYVPEDEVVSEEDFRKFMDQKEVC